MAKQAVPYLILVALFALTNGLLLRMPPACMETASAVYMALPQELGEWRGREPVYCQAESCLTVFQRADLAGAVLCPTCGGTLDAASLAERTQLPPDTEFAKMTYSTPAGMSVQVSIVLSGSEHRSIHRPQQCLPAQGFVIEGVDTVPVSVRAGRDLNVRVLTLARRLPGLSGQEATGQRTVFAYWFAAPGHETDSHLQRLGWMAIDRVLAGRNLRWADVAAATGLAPGEPREEAIARVVDFVAQLYPHIAVDEAPIPAGQ